MNEKQFKEHFIVTFLATWVANNYAFCCDNGVQEEAKYLANDAWREYDQK